MSEVSVDPVVITIYGPNSMIKGPYPVKEMEEATSFLVEGYEFSKFYRQGKWDGRTRLMSKRTGSFPTGLLDSVKKVCDEAGLEYAVVDKRQEPARMDIWGKPSFELAEGWILREYQLNSCKAAVKAKRGILKLCTGAGKSICYVAISAALNVPTLVLVPTRELLHQIRETFLSAMPNATEASIGVVGDDEWQPGTVVTIATVSTLYARIETEECQKLLHSVDLLIADEIHGAGSESYYDVAQSCTAYYRIGGSGTPYDRTDGGTLKLIASFGEMVAEVRYKELVDAKILPRAHIIFDKITTPILPKKPKLTYLQAYKAGVVQNEVLTKKVVQWTKLCVDQGLSVLILVDQIEHGKILDDALWTGVDGNMISHAFIKGADTGNTRSQSLVDFEARELPVLIATSILDTGISLNSLDVLILAGSKKSKIKSLQRLGRALRGRKALVIDFAFYINDFLFKHSQVRYRDYKGEDCFVMMSSSPKAETIKKAWDAQD